MQKFIKKTQDSIVPASLYVLATPIGNLSDISLRSLAILEKADLICAEDTRVGNKLLSAYGLRNHFISVREHNEQAIATKIIEYLQKGKTVAQISDAGTPAICDPGARLVRAVRSAGFNVIPIPGCCAAITALSVSGLDDQDFYFGGFLPAKQQERQKRLQVLSTQSSPVILYETPHRIVQALQDIHKIMPERKMILARELTKAYETIREGQVQDILNILLEDPNQQRGEMVLVLHGQQQEKNTIIDTSVQHTLSILVNSLPTKQAAEIAAEITGISKKILYNEALKLKEK